MSDPILPLIAVALAAPAPPPPVNLHTISFGLPSLDGFRGVQAAYERWVPDHHLGLAVSAQYRETATGEYTGLRGGIGVEVRWYWRADAWLSVQPAGSAVGWFVGARFDALIENTHDDVEDRNLGSTLELGVGARVGYRIAPWRGLEITPSLGVTERVDLPLSGRLPAWARPGLGGGLSVGWMF